MFPEYSALKALGRTLASAAVALAMMSVPSFSQGGGLPPAGNSGPPVSTTTTEELKIFILMGQSNMVGYGYASDVPYTTNKNVPTMDFLLSNDPAAVQYVDNMPFDFKNSLQPSWKTPRNDAWCLHYDSSNGSLKQVAIAPGNVVSTGILPLGPGFGTLANAERDQMFGPELGMGIRLAKVTSAPIFLFKSARGGTSLLTDWRSPQAVARAGGVVGGNYTNTIDKLIDLLDDLDADLADDGLLNAYGNASGSAIVNVNGYKIAGVFWFQGFADQGATVAEYARNLVDLIHSIRLADSRIPPALPFIVGESSDQNTVLNNARMAAVNSLNNEYPGSAAYFDTGNMVGADWGPGTSGLLFSNDFAVHYHERPENYLEIGWKAAGAVITNGYL